MFGRLFGKRKKPPPNPDRLWADSDADRWVLSVWAPYLERGNDMLGKGPHWFAKINGGFPSSMRDSCRETLDDDWGITDKQTTSEAIRNLLDVGHRAEYDRYRTFLVDEGLLGKSPEALTAVARFRVENDPEIAENNRDGAAEVLASIYQFIAENEPVLGDAGIGAWDYMRVGNVCLLALAADYVEPADCWDLQYEAARKAQATFGSWRQLVTSYNLGRRWWGYASAEQTAEFDQVCERLLTHPDSPWVQLAWETVLDPAAHPTTAEMAAAANVDAQYRLARQYRFGENVAQDAASAAHWMRRAAEAGSRLAQLDLATMVEAGEGVDKDMAEAARWYRTAAEQGDRFAQTSLAALYEDGDGVPQDYPEAVRWHRAAAEQGRVVSQFMLGYSLEVGRGVAADPAEAARWYRLAAEQGQRDAQERLGLLLAEGRGVERDTGKAVQWYRAAAEVGSPSAQTRLALLLRDIEDGDPVQALAWLTVAHENGYAPATSRLDAAARDLSESQVRQAREMAEAIAARVAG